jgi:hypothetical protein
MTLGTVVWAYVLLDRTPQWLPWLRVTLLVGGVVAAVALAAAGGLSRAGWRRALVAGCASLALVAALGGSAAYSFATAARPHTGPIPSSGPAGVNWAIGPGAGPGMGGGGPMGGPFARGNRRGGPNGAGALPGGAPPPGALPGVGGLPAAGNLPGNVPGGFAGGFPGGPGMFEEGTVSQELVDFVQQDSGRYRWAVAMTSANNAAPIQVAARVPVMAIGGFNGTDQLYSLERFKQDVRAGRIHYYIAGGGFAGSPNVGVSGDIAAWVRAGFKAKTVGGATVYDLTAAPPN